MAQTRGWDDQPSLSQEEYRERLRELPPSAKLVAKVLEIEESLSQSELAEETLMSVRTVRYALNDLNDSNLVRSRKDLEDARKRLYELTTA